MRNWGGPPRRLTSSEGGGYKPSAKSCRVERESEGPVVAGKAGMPLEREGPALVVPRSEIALERGSLEAQFALLGFEAIYVVVYLGVLWTRSM
jgi:hypothetical protein